MLLTAEQNFVVFTVFDLGTRNCLRCQPLFFFFFFFFFFFLAVQLNEDNKHLVQFLAHSPSDVSTCILFLLTKTNKTEAKETLR